MRVYFLSLFVLMMVACQPANPATPKAEAPLPTLRPTAELLALEIEDEETNEPASTGTPSANASTRQPDENENLEQPTPVPSVTPTIERINVEVQITSPELIGKSGGTLIISGRLRMNPDETAEVVAVAPDGTLLGASPVQPNEFGTFAAELALVPWFAGLGTTSVVVFDSSGNPAGQHSKQMRIDPDTSQDRYLSLYRPEEGEVAGVSGYYLFFDGYAQRPAGFRVAITLFEEDCRRQIARQSYTMRGSGYWQGFIVVPEEIDGLICALISFGEKGSTERREIQIPIEVLPRAEDQTPAVLIGNPPPGATAAAGETLTAYGTAYDAPGNQVQLTLLLGDGTIAGTNTAEVNRYGYWETDLLLPVDLNEETVLRATIGPLGDPAAVNEIFLTVGDS